MGISLKLYIFLVYMKVIVLFKKPKTLVFQNILFCFSTINIFLFIGKNVLIIGNTNSSFPSRATRKTWLRQGTILNLIHLGKSITWSSKVLYNDEKKNKIKKKVKK